nr:uncharacterized protein LOC113693445 [Coffea arabica]XP_027067787.1 uncharacterized protein LOC113693447 [Coffea arabica]
MVVNCSSSKRPQCAESMSDWMAKKLRTEAILAALLIETKEDSETLALLSGPIKEASNILQELINIHIDGKVILAVQGQVKDDKPTFIERLAVKSICGVFENLLTAQVGIPNEQLLQVISVLFLKLYRCRMFI